MTAMLIEHRNWTADEDHFLRAKNAIGWPDARIADALGCDAIRVTRRRNRLGIPRTGAVGCGTAGPHGCVIDEGRLAALNAAGWSDRRIARNLGESLNTVNRRRRRLGLPPNFLSGVAGAREGKMTADADAVRAAGWAFPVPGLPPALLPREVRILVVLLDGPLSAKDVRQALGLPAAAASIPLQGGRQRKAPLDLLRDAGLVARFVAPGTGGSRWEYLYFLTPYALDTFAAAGSKEAANG